MIAVTACAMLLGAATSAPAADVYWGANIGPHLTGGQPPYDMRAADVFESLAGKRMSLMEFSLPWFSCYTQPCEFKGFPTAQMEAIRTRGAIPVFGWASYSQPLTADEPDFKLSKITAGAYDTQLRQWATQAKAWGHPFFLQFDWEMNLGGVWPYVEARSGNEPGDFVKMWRHVHDVFTEVGATNATWTWCPNVEYPGSAKPLSGLYPGDAYVDWTCIDGYNWGTDLNGWKPFSEMFGPTYSVVQAIAPDKPLLIGETASSEHGGDKAAWIDDMLGTRLPRTYPNAKGFVWFEQNDTALGADWRIETTDAARSAFSAGIQSPYYASNDFTDVASPIPALSPLARATTSSGTDPTPTAPAGPGSTRSVPASRSACLKAASSKSPACAPRCVLKLSRSKHRYVHVCAAPRCVRKTSKRTGKRVTVCRSSTKSTARRPASAKR